MTRILSKPLGIAGLALAALLAACILVSAHSTASQPSVVPALGGSSPNPGIRGGNRHAVMGVDQMGIGFEGVFALDNPNAAASIRFRSQGRRALESISLFYRTVGTPGSVRVTLRSDDGDGQPARGASPYLGVFQPQAPTALGSWHRITLGNPWPLQEGSVHHLVIEPVGTVSASDRIELITARSRFPVPPQQHTGLAPAEWAYAAFFDSTSLMLDEDVTSGNGFVTQRSDFKAFSPIFVLEFMRGKPFGQPYNLHQEYSIHGNQVYGQSVELRHATEINWIGSFVRGWGLTGDPEPLGDLDLSIHRVDSAGTSLVLTQTIALRTDNLFRGRSHWFGAYIPNTILEPGPDVEYFFMLSSQVSQADEGYVYSMSNSDHPLAANVLPTYMGVRSRSIVSQDGGQTFQTLSFKGDSAFMYGFFDPQEPFAVHDETGGDTMCSSGATHFPSVAEPGQSISFTVWCRNIGEPSQESELYARLVDVATGLPILDTYYIALDTNTETATLTGTAFDLIMPNTDLRLLLETGHIVNGSTMVADDWTPMEVRVDVECP